MRGRPAPIGTRKTNLRGYVLVKLGRLDPRANNTGWQYEQRLVMAEKLGRPLRSDEEVQHRNNDRSDNRPENLRLLRGGLEVAGDPPHCATCRC